MTTIGTVTTKTRDSHMDTWVFDMMVGNLYKFHHKQTLYIYSAEGNYVHRFTAGDTILVLKKRVYKHAGRTYDIRLKFLHIENEDTHSCGFHDYNRLATVQIQEEHS